MKILRNFTFLLIFCFSFQALAQNLTGEQLLEKSINYHDPEQKWFTFEGKFIVTMSTPDGKERISHISIDLPKEYFQLTSIQDSVNLQQTINKQNCELSVNGNSNPSEESLKKHRLSCERAHLFKNYYTYLYGLPMKLKDIGTIIHSKTQKKTFKGKTYLVLKATYDKEVGNDTWYFYFDPNTYAMEVYQFFHDESKNDGEYILLTGEEEVSGIKMPKTRAWYYNTDDKYLGTDVLTK